MHSQFGFRVATAMEYIVKTRALLLQSL